MSCLVSVVVPCYNVEKYIDKCIASLLNQKCDFEYEIICVNDGSTDATLNKLNAYNGEPRVKIISKQNGGVSSARNVGILKSTGKWITFTDPDDYVTDDYLATLVCNAEKYNADMSVCDFRRVAECRTKKFKSKNKVKVLNGECILEELFYQKTMDICVWNKLYNASILRGGQTLFNESVRYAEDIAFNYFYLKKCNIICYSKKICYYYVQHKKSLVHSSLSKNKQTSFIDVARMVEDSLYDEKLKTLVYGWRALVSLEFLYYVWRDKYYDPLFVLELMKNLKEGLPYLKRTKRLTWIRKHLTKYGYVLAKILLYKQIKQAQKDKLNKKT